MSVSRKNRTTNTSKDTKIKANSKDNKTPVIVDEETSEFLKSIKYSNTKKENKPKETKEKDKNRFLDTDITIGLTKDQVNKRIAQGLTNKTNNDRGKSILEIIISNVFTAFNILYFIIAVVLIIIDIKKDDSFSNLFFLLLVFSNTIIGIYQEIKSKLTVDKLKILSNPKAWVIRDGEKKEIPVEDIVLDDIIIFQSGKQVSADSVILEGNIEVNEALLTGESDSIAKGVGGELLSGSFMTSGTCIARVDKVGNDCYINKMSSDAKKYAKPHSELLATLRKIIYTISILILPVIILYLLSHISFKDFDKSNFGYWMNDFWEALNKGESSTLSAICYIVLAMIPAGLFLLTSIALFVGVRRLAKRNTLVQELYCIEMLARVDTLCLDKTGTLTDGTMVVSSVEEISKNNKYTLKEIIGSMLNSFEEENPTSIALKKYFGVNKVLKPLEIIPFSSKRKFSAVNFDEEGTYILGAPDFVIQEGYSKISEQVSNYAKEGCRVIVLGHIQSKIKNDTLPKNVKAIALINILDTIRDDAQSTISFFKQNDVDIKVISGDNPETVARIAQRVGILNSENYINLNGLSDDEVRKIVFDYSVFGRVSPGQKKIIVQELKKQGKTVAMTGDGVNDIPALKEADCSIAMASGSEAARYVSHLVLLDSNFSSMPRVVMEGRRVINNVQKTSALYLTKNLFAFLMAVMYIIIGFASSKRFLNNTEFPFRSENLMLIEMIILGVASTILAVQPNNEIVRGKFLNNILKRILPNALIVLLFQIILFSVQSLRSGTVFGQLYDYPSVYRTISSFITTLIMLFVLYDECRPFNRFRIGVFVLTVVLIIALILIPFTRSFIKFEFGTFGDTEWLLLIIMSLSISPIRRLVNMILVKTDENIKKRQ